MTKWTNKELLEIWGHTLLQMAKLSKGSEGFFDLFQNGYAKKTGGTDSTYQQLVEICQRAFGKEGVETFNAILKEFYENVGVVPRAQYNALQDKYVVLKEKVKELEEKIEKLKGRIQSGLGTSDDLMEQWTETTQQYAEINRKFFEEFSKFFK
jgi:hypothetical protein